MELTVQITANGIHIPREIFGENTPLELIVQDDFAVVRPIQHTPSRFSVDPRRAEMSREVQAYEAQHPELASKYLGQFVAFHNGKLVDVDSERQQLRRRIRTKYGDQIVLIRQVQDTLPEPLRLGSPRLIAD